MLFFVLEVLGPLDADLTEHHLGDVALFNLEHFEELLPVHIVSLELNFGIGHYNLLFTPGSHVHEGGHVVSALLAQLVEVVQDLLRDINTQTLIIEIRLLSEL